MGLRSVMRMALRSGMGMGLKSGMGMGLRSSMEMGLGSGLGLGLGSDMRMGNTIEMMRRIRGLIQEWSCLCLVSTLFMMFPTNETLLECICTNVINE